MFRWLVVGMGMAGRVHAAAIDLSPRAQLAAVVSSRGQDLAVPVFATLDEALAKCDFDGVVISTPNLTHRVQCVKVVESGFPVLCEKPVGADLGEARAIQTAADAAGVPVGVVLNQRACRYARFIKELAAQRTLLAESCHFHAEMPRLRGWVAEAGQGGGLLRAIGVHYVDLLCWWFGLPERFEATLDGVPVDDRLALELQFRDGLVGRVDLSATAAHGSGPVRCVIQGPGQTIEVRGSEIVRSTGVPDAPAPEPPDPRLWFGPGHATLIDEASAALAAGDGFPISLADGMATLELIDAMASRPPPQR